MHPSADILSNPGFLLGILALAVLLGGGLYAIMWVRDWRQRLKEEDSEAEDESQRFFQLYQQGELSKEEYEQICRKLGMMAQPDSDEEKGTA